MEEAALHKLFFVHSKTHTRGHGQIHTRRRYTNTRVLLQGRDENHFNTSGAVVTQVFYGAKKDPLPFPVPLRFIQFYLFRRTKSEM